MSIRGAVVAVRAQCSSSPLGEPPWGVRETGSYVAGIIDKAVVVADQISVGARRDGSEPCRSERTERGGDTEREEFHWNGGAELVDELVCGGNTKRSAAAATIFSPVWAPPPPLISQPEGATWSAPSIARSSPSNVLNGSTFSPSSSAICSVRGEGCDVGDESHAHPVSDEDHRGLSDRFLRVIVGVFQAAVSMCSCARRTPRPQTV
jgi:hypothetical protein